MWPAQTLLPHTGIRSVFITIQDLEWDCLRMIHTYAGPSGTRHYGNSILRVFFVQPPNRLRRCRGRIESAWRQAGGNKRSRIFPGNRSVSWPTPIRYGIAVSNPPATFVAFDSSPTPALKYRVGFFFRTFSVAFCNIVLLCAVVKPASVCCLTEY